MTTQNKPTTEAAEQISPDAATQNVAKSADRRSPATPLAILAIMVSLGLTGGLYWHGHQTSAQASLDLAQRDQALQIQINKQINSRIQTALDEYSRELKTEQADILTQLQAEQAQSQSLKQQLNEAMARNKSIEARLAQLDVGDLNQWRLFESQYLIHLAGRKLWLEHDLGAAKSLLNSANKSIAHLDNPHLLPLRRAIIDDINQIDTIDNVDTDGIVLQLSSLIDQVGDLTLADVQLPAVVDTPVQVADESLENWRTNLTKSWRHFAENFITIRRRDGQVDALIEPRATWYLQENIKLALQQAQVAATRQKPELFSASLKRAQKWIGQYFQANTAAKHLVSSLNTLASQSILTPLPDNLASIKLIDETIEARQKNLTAGIEQ
jgi:uroporphyrin-3 C-methyltransferase